MDKQGEQEAYWQGHIEAWRASGETQRAYCDRQGLKRHSLSYWHCRQVRREAVSAGGGLTLVPALIRPEVLAPMPGLSLHSPGGWRLEFSTLPPARWLTELWGERP